jgi:hypothetical protein
MTACLISPLADHRVHPVRTRAVVRPLSRARAGTVLGRSVRPLKVVPPVVATPPDPPGMEEVQRLLAGVLEALDGRRPVAQLEGVLPRRYQRELLTSPGPGPRRLRSLHLSRTEAEIIDVCGRVEQTNRSRALTGRMAYDQGKWLLTELQFV